MQSVAERHLYWLTYDIQPFSLSITRLEIFKNLSSFKLGWIRNSNTDSNSSILRWATFAKHFRTDLGETILTFSSFVSFSLNIPLPFLVCLFLSVVLQIGDLLSDTPPQRYGIKFRIQCYPFLLIMSVSYELSFTIIWCLTEMTARG